ncbi:MAG: hypothetical protein ABJH06_15155 [Paraglaciecola sp.]|uniref:hypothetical protein n=1 Tax=Paraglaciecola sp. TaxID=1920173 RepID=UPI0032971039
MKNFIYILLILTFPKIVLANELNLDKTNLYVITPQAIVYQTSITNSQPSLNFNLPKDKHGGTPGWPDFKIIRWNKTISTYLDENRNNKFSDFHLLKNNVKIDGIKTYETSGTGIVVADFVGGGSAQGNVKTHAFILDFNSYIISCSMTSGTKNHEKHISTLKELCFSIHSKVE